MDIKQIIGAVLMGVAKIISNPPMARATERKLEAVFSSEVKPIWEEEARRTKTILRGSATFPKGAEVTEDPAGWFALLPRSTVRVAFRSEKRRRGFDQQYIMERHRHGAVGKRLELVGGYPAVMLRSEFDTERGPVVLHELYVLVDKVVYVLALQVGRGEESRRTQEIGEFFASFNLR